MNVVDEIVDFAKRIANGEEDVLPGQPLNFTEASTINDRIWQGDMAITITNSEPPKDFVEKKDVLVQLVPGNTTGAKHCLQSKIGVEQWVPQNWTELGLIGPWMRFSEPNTILHPVHGSVSVPAGFCVQITYQREYDEIQKAERRAAD
jgi:hypothetical protein